MILGTAGGWQLLPLLTPSITCQLAPLQAQHDEENPAKSLSLPLLPKLHPCRTDTLASEGAGECCGDTLMPHCTPDHGTTPQFGAQFLVTQRPRRDCTSPLPFWACRDRAAECRWAHILVQAQRRVHAVAGARGGGRARGTGCAPSGCAAFPWQLGHWLALVSRAELSGVLPFLTAHQLPHVQLLQIFAKLLAQASWTWRRTRGPSGACS